MNSKWVWVGAAVIIIIVVAGGFFFLNTNKSTTPASNEAAITSSPQVSEDQSETNTVSEREITVEGSEFKLTPSEITVKKGERVKITFTNTGNVQHDFVIADLGVATKRINPGESDTVEFIPDESGQFGFICSVGNHEELGMVGNLIVKE